MTKPKHKPPKTQPPTSPKSAPREDERTATGRDISQHEPTPSTTYPAEHQKHGSTRRTPPSESQ